MLLLCCCGRLMIKRPTIAACNGRFRRRKHSAIRTLVAETLVLAKTHGYVEKIESELEAELARDISDPPEDKLLRWRRKGDTIFKSKHVLLTVVLLCVLDCALVLGELTLDLYKVKATLGKTNELTKATHAFVAKMEQLHPHLDSESPYDMFTMLLNSAFIWTDDINGTHLARNAPAAVPCSNTSQGSNANLDVDIGSGELKGEGHENGSAVMTLPGFTSKSYVQDERDLEIVGKIAHIFHYLSIAILLIILVETILKAICAGPDFFRRKLEVFDATIVILSFLVDFSFLLFLPDIDTNDFVFVLSILLPWRVIRVVNSLVVSVKDHEHFRLKLVYKRKKKIQGNLRDTEAMLQKYMSQVTTLQRLCIMEGIDEWKVDNHLKNDEMSQPVTPNKRKFKFKFDDSGITGHNRGARCSMPSLDLHGIRLPSNVHVSRSRISLPAVANSIKNTISKNLPIRRSSFASVELFGTKMSNGDVRKKKMTSEDLGTMEEENIDDLDNHDSALSSRATSESGDVFSRLSVSDSIGSDRVFAEMLNKNGDERRDSVNTIDEKDERIKLAKIKADAKRRHSESNIDKKRVSLAGLTEGVTCTTLSGKTYTKPQGDACFNYVELHSVNNNSEIDSCPEINDTGDNAPKGTESASSETNKQTAEISTYTSEQTEDKNKLRKDLNVIQESSVDVGVDKKEQKTCSSVGVDVDKKEQIINNFVCDDVDKKEQNNSSVSVDDHTTNSFVDADVDKKEQETNSSVGVDIDRKKQIINNFVCVDVDKKEQRTNSYVSVDDHKTNSFVDADVDKKEHKTNSFVDADVEQTTYSSVSVDDKTNGSVGVDVDNIEQKTYSSITFGDDKTNSFVGVGVDKTNNHVGVDVDKEERLADSDTTSGSHQTIETVVDIEHD